MNLVDRINRRTIQQGRVIRVHGNQAPFFPRGIGVITERSHSRLHSACSNPLCSVWLDVRTLDAGGKLSHATGVAVPECEIDVPNDAITRKRQRLYTIANGGRGIPLSATAFGIIMIAGIAAAFGLVPCLQMTLGYRFSVLVSLAIVLPPTFFFCWIDYARTRRGLAASIAEWERTHA